MNNSILDKVKVISDSLTDKGLKHEIKSSPQKGYVNIKISEDCYMVAESTTEYIKKRCTPT